MLQGLPDPGICRSAFGVPVDPTRVSGLTLDHVKDELRMGKRAPDDPAHLWTICAHHHVTTSWVTHADVRMAARAYIAAANEAAAANGWVMLPGDVEAALATERDPSDLDRLGW